HIRFTARDRFAPMTSPPTQFFQVSVAEWRAVWNRRLRPFLVTSEARELYREIAAMQETRRFCDLATIGIGYVSGDNEFFHLRPSDAQRYEIPRQFLHASVRKGRSLPEARLTNRVVEDWKRDNDPILLLKIPKTTKTTELPRSVQRYLG